MRLTQAIENFDKYLGGKSGNTRKTYANALNRFCEHKGDVDVTNLTIDDVPAFAGWLHERGLSRATVNLYLTVVTRFFRWLMFRKHADITAADFLLLQEELTELRGNRGTRRLPKLPKEAAVSEAMETAMTLDDPDDERLHLLHLRNRALLATLESTGCRIAEIAGLKRDDLDAEGMTAIVTGKGDKRRTVFFSEGAWQAVQEYLAARDKAGLTATGAEPLMGRHDKTAHGQGLLLGISTNAIEDAVRGLCQRAGVSPIKPHGFRHRRATEFLRQTHDLNLTKQLLGHASVSTTQIYTHLDTDDLETAIRG